MCIDCSSHAALNMAFTGSILIGLPFTQSNPAGLFIHALADTTKIPDITPEILTITPDIQCIHLFSLFHPYKNIPNAIASTKNAVPSHEKGMPIIAPACCINVGHSKPSSNESTVPDTAPTAKKIATPFDHALVISKKTSLPVRSQRHSLKAIRTGIVIPMQANTI